MNAASVKVSQAEALLKAQELSARVRRESLGGACVFLPAILLPLTCLFRLCRSG